MSGFADLKANIVTATESLSINNGTNSITINPTTISGTSLTISGTNLNASTVTATNSLSINNGTNSITINPTTISGTSLTISGTNLVMSNANLSGTTTCTQSLLPSYSYPVSAGRIGEIITGTTTTLAYSGNSSPSEVARISLTKGVWILTSYIKTNGFAGVASPSGGYAINSIGPIANSFTDIIVRSNYVVYTGYELDSTISTPISINSSAIYYVNYQSNNPGPIVKVTFNAVRIA